MPQGQLPIFPEELTLINMRVGFEKRDGVVYYFHGHLPLFHHDEDDLRSFRLITSQIVVSGIAKQMEIVRAFGISVISVKRYVKVFREKGAAGFFAGRKAKSSHVITEQAVEEAEQLFREGATIPEVGRALDIKADTLRKAIKRGQIKKKPQERS